MSRVALRVPCLEPRTSDVWSLQDAAAAAKQGAGPRSRRPASSSLSDSSDDSSSDSEAGSAPAGRALPAAATESPEDGPDFFSDVRWSPDGSCLMTVSDQGRVRVFELDVAAALQGLVSDPGPLPDWQSLGRLAIEVDEHAPVYDVAWHPRLQSAVPDTCVFATAPKDTHVRVRDAFTGATRVRPRPSLARRSFGAFSCHSCHGPTLTCAFSLRLCLSLSLSWCRCPRAGTVQDCG